MVDYTWCLTNILLEAQKAKDKYGPFNSTHESYAVLIEEVEEYFEEIRKHGSKERHISELIQIASIAIRTITELDNGEIKHV